MSTQPEFQTDIVPSEGQLIGLYESVRWNAYLKAPEGLHRAVTQTTFLVTAWDGESLIGLARVLSDDVVVVYFQDILVHPSWQRKGVGRGLVKTCLDRFKHVRQRVLLTDDDEGQRLFYESLGFVNTRRLSPHSLNAYVMIDGVTDDIQE